MPREICVGCKSNLATSKGRGKYHTLCSSCKKKPWQQHKKQFCEFCGFVPVHPCQLDVDHIDGNKRNNCPTNYQTLCANCHRLKTHLHRDNEA